MLTASQIHNFTFHSCKLNFLVYSLLQIELSHSEQFLTKSISISIHHWSQFQFFNFHFHFEFHNSFPHSPHIHLELITWSLHVFIIQVYSPVFQSSSLDFFTSCPLWTFLTNEGIFVGVRCVQDHSQLCRLGYSASDVIILATCLRCFICIGSIQCLLLLS